MYVCSRWLLVVYQRLESADVLRPFICLRTCNAIRAAPRWMCFFSSQLGFNIRMKPQAKGIRERVRIWSVVRRLCILKSLSSRGVQKSQRPFYFFFPRPSRLHVTTPDRPPSSLARNGIREYLGNWYQTRAFRKWWTARFAPLHPIPNNGGSGFRCLPHVPPSKKKELPQCSISHFMKCVRFHLVAAGDEYFCFPLASLPHRETGEKHELNEWDAYWCVKLNSLPACVWKIPHNMVYCLLASLVTGFCVWCRLLYATDAW